MDKSASDTGAHHLGKRKLQNKSSTKIQLDVKLRNESQPKSLPEVFMAYLTENFPNFASDSINIPQFFNYKTEKNIHGYPRLAYEKQVSESWNVQAKGQMGEEKVFNYVQRSFKDHTSLMLQGFELRNMLRLAKEQQQENTMPNQVCLPLSQLDIDLGRMLDINIDQIDTEAADIVEYVLKDTNKDTVEQLVLKNKKANLKKLQEERKKKKKKKDEHTVQKNDQEKEKKEEYTLKIINILQGVDRSLSREEAKNAAVRYLYDIRMKDNQELDTIVVDKESKTIFHFETKVPSSDDTLKSNIKSACGQIKKGRHLINNILTFGVKLSGWSTIGFVCLPMLKDKQLLEELGIESKFRKFFLTEKELESEDCMLDLQSYLNESELDKLNPDINKTKEVQKETNTSNMPSKERLKEERRCEEETQEEEVDGESPPKSVTTNQSIVQSEETVDQDAEEKQSVEEAEEEYTNLLSWIIGALNCTINSQTFDYASDFNQVTQAITGNWEEVAEAEDTVEISNCCTKCKKAIPIMVKKKKTKAEDLETPKKCKVCSNKSVKKAFYNWCTSCAVTLAICAKCGEANNNSGSDGATVTEQGEEKRQRKRVVGIPSGTLSGIQGIPAQALSGKPLGHALSVMFWNDGQSSLLRCLRKGESGILLADYGCGKTSLLMAAANMAAEDLASNVFFISAANWAAMRVGCHTEDIIMDQALKIKFRNTRVHVVSANELCEKYSNEDDQDEEDQKVPDIPEKANQVHPYHCSGCEKLYSSKQHSCLACPMLYRYNLCHECFEMGIHEEHQPFMETIELETEFNTKFTDETTVKKTKSAHRQLRKFVKEKGDENKIKIFIDEFPVSEDDLKHMKGDLESDLTVTLRTVRENCAQMWVALATGDLMDIKDGGTIMDSSSQNLADIPYLGERTCCQVHDLRLKMRNTGNIANIAPENMSAFGVMTWDGSDPVAMLPVAEPSTVPGPKPHCVFVNINTNKEYSVYYGTLGKSIQYALSNSILHYSQTGEHLAILCNGRVSPRMVAEDLRSAGHAVSLYDVGVKNYAKRYEPLLFEEPDDDRSMEVQKSELEEWLTGPGGILVTHNSLFVGLEAPTVILLSADLASESEVRSGMLRAVTRLVLICDAHLNQAKEYVLEKVFVMHKPDFGREYNKQQTEAKQTPIQVEWNGFEKVALGNYRK